MFFVRQKQRGFCQESENQMQLGNFKSTNVILL
jgi:hypothetical protein